MCEYVAITQGVKSKYTYETGKDIDGDDTAMVSGAGGFEPDVRETIEAAERISKHVKEWLRAEQRQAREPIYFR